MKNLFKILSLAIILLIGTRTHCQPPPPPPAGYCFKFTWTNVANIKSTSVDLQWKKCIKQTTLNHYNLTWYIGDSSNATRKTLKNFKDSTYHLSGLLSNKQYICLLRMYGDSAYDTVAYVTYNFTTLVSRVNNLNGKDNSFDFNIINDQAEGKILLNIDKDSSPADFRIFNPAGIMVYSLVIREEGKLTKELNLSYLPKGIYFIRGATNSEVKTLKFCIN